MTPKEKANDLFNKYFSELRFPSDCEGCMQCVDRCGNTVAVAKKYSLIAVDEMIIQNGELYLLGLVKDYYIEKNAYLFNVKSELQSL
jgi:hypothetical protein